jgi:hypothetical protein
VGERRIRVGAARALARLAAAGVLVALAAASPVHAAERPVVRVGDAPARSAVLRDVRETAELEYRYRLPAGAAQGPDAWYTIRLHYRVAFARESGPGLVWVTAETNGRTSAQVEYTLRRPSGALRVRETSVDIVRGQVERSFEGRTSEVRFRNYLQNAGVRAGDNVLRIRVEQAGGARVERLEVLEDSGVYRTDRSPYPLRIDVGASERAIRVGETFSLVVEVSNRTGEPLRDVAVRPTFDPRAFELRSPPVRRFARVAAPTRAVFELRALSVGGHRVDVLADSSRNHPSVAVRVTVAPSAPSSAVVAAVWTGALLPVVLLLGWLLRGRMRPG